MTPLDTVKAFMKAMEPLDYDTAATFLSDDCEYTNPPPIGTVRGPAGMRAVLEPFFAPTYEVHDGRITYWRDYFDLATIMAHWPSA